MAAQFWGFFEYFFENLISFLSDAQMLGYSILSILFGCGILTAIVTKIGLMHPVGSNSYNHAQAKKDEEELFIH